MRMVKQKKFGECGIACLAMVSDLSYGAAKEVIAKLIPEGTQPETHGVTAIEVVAALKRLGYEYAREVIGPPPLGESGILTVASLNHPGLLHFVVWDGENDEIFDPSPGPLVFPDDAPVICGVRMTCAATSIVWDQPREENSNGKQ